MNEVKIFNSEEFGDIRTVQLNNEIYFLGKDIAEALGYSNTRDALATHIADEDKKYRRDFRRKKRESKSNSHQRVGLICINFWKQVGLS